MDSGAALLAVAAVESVSMKQEVVLLAIGGLIAIISSIATLIITKLMDKTGKLKIYKKIVYAKLQNGVTWGFLKGESGLFFQIPLWIEIHNTSNSTKIVRNFNVWLYKNKKAICPMTSATQIDNIVLANNGAYSFVIEPRSIKRYDCHFIIKKSDMPGDCFFDEVKIIYFDESDKRKIVDFINIAKDECWSEQEQKIDPDWTLLSK